MQALTNIHRFTHLGWDVRISLHGRPDLGRLMARAELRDTCARSHLLELDSDHRRGATALVALAAKARAFIERCAAAH